MREFASGYPDWQCGGNKKCTILRKESNTNSPGKGPVKRGCSEMCVVTNQAVTEPDPAGTSGAPPAVSAVLAYTSTLHHEKGF